MNAIEFLIAASLFLLGLFCIGCGWLVTQGVIHMPNPWADVGLVIAGFTSWMAAWLAVVDSQFNRVRC